MGIDRCTSHNPRLDSNLKANSLSEIVYCVINLGPHYYRSVSLLQLCYTAVY